MSELKVESWTNSIGQVINPGDPVVAITKSTGRVGIKTGKFAGVRYGDVRRWVDVVDANGQQVFEERYGRQYPKKELKTFVEIVAVSISDVPRKTYKNVAPKGEGYKYEMVDTVGTATLPNKRVFKIDTTAATLSSVNL